MNKQIYTDEIMMKKISIKNKLVFLLLAFPVLASARSTHLTIADTRNTATVPGGYSQKLKSEFKLGTSVGFADAAYRTLFGLRGWSDDSGGPAHELAFSNTDGIFYRTGTQAAGWTVWRRVLSENPAGNVGTGTDTPKEKLSVNGNVRAQQVKVEVANWPDYVFAPGYKMTGLSETEAFIKKNGHLPEVPNAAEAEANGVSVGAMNKILLKKIEELTLNAIESEKKVQQMDARIMALENPVRSKRQ